MPDRSANSLEVRVFFLLRRARANGRTLTFARRVSRILAGEEVKEYT